MTRSTEPAPISYAGYRFPPEVISYTVWLYFRFPLSLRMVEEMLAARSIDVTYETVRQWALKFGQQAVKRIRARVSTFGDKWYLDEVVITINKKRHWLWRAVDEHGYVLDVLVQSRRHIQAAERLMRTLLRKHGKTPRVMVTDKLKIYAAAKKTRFEVRAPSAQGAQQPGGELPRTHQGAREGDAPLHISLSDAAFLVGARPGSQPVHELSLQPRCKAKKGTAYPGVRSPERGDCAKMAAV